MRFENAKNPRSYFFISIIAIFAIVCAVILFSIAKDESISVKIFLIFFAMLAVIIVLQQVWRIFPREITIKEDSLVIRTVVSTKKYSLANIREVVRLFELFEKKATLYIILTNGRKPYVGSCTVSSRRAFDDLDQLVKYIVSKNAEVQQRIIYDTQDDNGSPREIKNKNIYWVNRTLSYYGEGGFSQAKEENIDQDARTVQDEYGFLFGRKR